MTGPFPPTLADLDSNYSPAIIDRFARLVDFECAITGQQQLQHLRGFVGLLSSKSTQATRWRQHEPFGGWRIRHGRDP